MSHLLDTVKRNGYIYKVYEDESPEDPRAWENMGYLQTVYHRDAGERNEPPFDGEVMIELPVYLYSHSGVCISTDSFSDPWDSGLWGVYRTTDRKVKESYGNTSEESLKRAKECMIAEIEILSRYMEGDNFGVVQYDEETMQELDSLWGGRGTDYEGFINANFSEEENHSMSYDTQDIADFARVIQHKLDTPEDHRAVQRLITACRSNNFSVLQ